MCELFAMSSKLPTKVTFSLEEFARHGGLTGHHSDGWGLAFYEGAYAQVFREAEPAASSKWMQFLQNHPHQSNCVISHIRRATQGGRALRNTQPFSRELGGHRHVFCHNGNLLDIAKEINLQHSEPIGETDSEYAFCYLLGEIEEVWRQDPGIEKRREIVKKVFDRLSVLGPANFLYSDGDYLYAYANKRTQPNGRIDPPGMFYLCRSCEHDDLARPLTGVNIEKPQELLKQHVVLFASIPLSSENWIALEPKQLIVAKDGRIIRDSAA